VADVNCAFLESAPDFGTFTTSFCVLPDSAFFFGTPDGAGIGVLIDCSFDELRGNLQGK
jgi:hypothetical protein